MKQLKYKVGDAVRFTFEENGKRPSSTEWREGAKEGRGVVINSDNGGGYPVKVTNPSDWEEGHGCGNRLTGPDAEKGWFFSERSLRPAETARTPSVHTKPITREKSGDDGTRAFFMKTKEEPAVPCPNPGCGGAETQPLLVGHVCLICGWKDLLL